MAKLAGFCLAVCVLVAVPSLVRAEDTPDCHVGSYRQDGGAVIDIAPDDDHSLRWRKFDGTTGALHQGADGVWKSTSGWSDRPDGTAVSFSACDKGQMVFDGVSGQRIALDVQDVTFQSHDASLAGRLLMPPGREPVPIVVLVHGSEPDSALIDYSLQRMLPAEGIGAFVYDKRGTGKSQGHYTQDFSLLADDAVAALLQARHLAGTRLGRIGYQAGSQGGWVAPIAANRTAVDFVIVCFGLAVNVIDEDQEAVELQLREKGYSAEDISHARAVASAAESVFASGFQRGFEQFDAVRARYKNAPWYKDLRGDYTWMLLPHSESELRAMCAEFCWGTPFYYDPMPTLRAGRVPQLWILGGEDYEAPSAETRRRLQSLRASGKPYTVAYYPKAEHGITLFETAPDGSRISTRYAPGYFALIRDFARDGKLHGSYGDAEVTAPSLRTRN
jgi:pimeloyl-ACP methyl ester carboxylesterase